MNTREIDWTQLKRMLEGLEVKAKQLRDQHPGSAQKAA
jgi:hypothetical protein